MAVSSATFQAVKIIVSISMYIFTYIVDILVARHVYRARPDNPKAGHVIVGFIAAPSMICNLTLAYFIIINFVERRRFRILVWLCALCQVLPLFWMFWACWSVLKGHSESQRMVKWTVYLKFAQACMEGFPEVAMQSSLILRILQFTLRENTSSVTNITSTAVINSMSISVTDSTPTEVIDSTLIAVTNHSIISEPTPIAILPPSIYLVLTCMAITFLITCYSFIDFYITIINKPDDDEEPDEVEGEKMGNHKIDKELSETDCDRFADLKAAVLLTATVVLGLGSRMYICSLLSTYYSGLWVLPMVVAIVAGYIYWRTCEAGAHVESLMFGMIGIMHCGKKSTLPATLTVFLIAAITFAFQHSNVLCIAGLGVTTVAVAVNILLARLKY